MVGIILATHGNFATGIQQSASMIFGEQPNVAAVTLQPNEGPDDVRKKMEEAVASFEDPEQVLILVDLWGGTPFNQANGLIAGHEDTWAIVAGLNLPMLIDAYASRMMMDTAHELAVQISGSAKEGVKIYPESLEPKEEKKVEPILDIHSIPAPHRIKASLDDYVVGQEHAKKVMSVAVYNHYKRVMADNKHKAQEENTTAKQASNKYDGVEIEKSNMLMIGPTGSGKTYLVKTLAKLLDVPLAITDATSLTEAGYIGDDIESVVSKLLAAADNDVERAEHGIIFIDEIDKLAKKRNANQRDVSGESVQQGMLKLLEGSEVEVPVGASSKNAMVPMTTVDTRNILFICGGAFPGLEDIIKERLNKEASIGFKADLKDKYDGDENLLMQATVDDIRKFGMIPEFIGRLPIMFSLEALTEDMLVKILKEPKNAIIKQYQKLLEMDEVRLEFDDDALYAIAKMAKEKKVGARALRAIIEDFMLDIMYEIPKDDNIGTVTITKDYVEKKGGPLIQMRGTPELADSQHV